ncbi:MAG: DUF983 domain-containing protein [Saprospiraceae bacterium]|nr:DUF983 domain-containing protein [Candidatus Vicinibacter proximus]MBL7824952.1 DUF983 domain-containing protein [Saprospiraceae bacterium]MCC6841764.1 DUF983 domain-containing protein [Saprospiraceae bacterium]
MTKLSAIIKLKCPACWEGNLFVKEGSPLSFNFEMHKRCPHCNENLDREPGFYFGAMFISYIISGFFSLFVVGGLILFFKVDWEISLVVLAIILVALYAYLYKISRSIWIHFFVSKKK